MKDIKRFLGENVRKMRTELGMTQNEFAERTALSVSFIQNIETGKRWAGPDTLAILARALKVRAADLLHDGTSQAHPDPKHLLQVISHALGIELEEHVLKKSKVNRSFSYYSKFYHACPEDIGELLLELCQGDGWDWDHLRSPLLQIKKSKHKKINAD